MSCPDQTRDDARPASKSTKAQRILACLQCQQRKVKCDRRFPCASCMKSQSTCVPASTLASRQRRRRFPERELLDRLRHYESLLRQNNISFEPLHLENSIGQTQLTGTPREGPGHGSPGHGSPGRMSTTGTDQMYPPAVKNHLNAGPETRYALDAFSTATL